LWLAGLASWVRRKFSVQERSPIAFKLNPFIYLPTQVPNARIMMIIHPLFTYVLNSTARCQLLSQHEHKTTKTTTKETGEQNKEIGKKGESIMIHFTSF
jgi:hypothetical protein